MSDEQFSNPADSAGPLNGFNRAGSGAEEGAGVPIDSTDLQILDDLRETLVALDPLPAGLDQRLTFQVSLALMNAKVAEIQREPAGVRAGVDVAESVTFSSGSTTLMVMVSREDDGIQIDGWVNGVGIEVELVQRDQHRVAVSDANGRLSFPNVMAGHTQFVIRSAAGGRPVVTPPMEL